MLFSMMLYFAKDEGWNLAGDSMNKITIVENNEV
jgi:hypothetical protein